jgi:hypothetical protein
VKQLLVLLALAGVSPAAAAPEALPPEVVLIRYVHALATVPVPAIVSFQYNVEQLGGRDIEQTHRVYRSGDDERDETLSVDGQKLVPPQIRIFRSRRDRYVVTNIAPRAEAYDFAFVGVHTTATRVDYVFRATAKQSGTFAVTQVTLDGTRFLPLDVQFATIQNGVQGTGEITYGPSGKYWVPLVASANVSSAIRGGRERITFGSYDFPPSLPPGTFGIASP